MWRVGSAACPAPPSSFHWRRSPSSAALMDPSVTLMFIQCRKVRSLAKKAFASVRRRVVAMMMMGGRGGRGGEEVSAGGCGVWGVGQGALPAAWVGRLSLTQRQDWVCLDTLSRLPVLAEARDGRACVEARGWQSAENRADEQMLVRFLATVWAGCSPVTRPSRCGKGERVVNVRLSAWWRGGQKGPARVVFLFQNVM